MISLLNWCVPGSVLDSFAHGPPRKTFFSKLLGEKVTAATIKGRARRARRKAAMAGSGA
jgi:hypothetical protein